MLRMNLEVWSNVCRLRKDVENGGCVFKLKNIET